MTKTHTDHIPVLLEEAIDLLTVTAGRWYIDCTFGQGGHTAALLTAQANVVAFEWDERAYTAGLERFAEEINQQQLILVRENFTRITEVWRHNMPNQQPSGILFDLGTSTQQLLSTDRGFSFSSDSSLDMRMDTRLGVRAVDLLTVLSVKQLTDVFSELGGEEEAHRIATAIKASPQPIHTTQVLADLIARTKRKGTGLHPATKVFQALRIAVNMELDNISEALPQALELLPRGGRLVTIAFHEGEDSIVKHLFKLWEKNQLCTILTKKPITPSEAELRRNPRSRSSKLRAMEKL